MDSDTEGIIIGIVIFALLAIFVAAVIAGWYLSDKPTNAPIPLSSPGGFLSPCTTNPCNTGLACDGSTFVCKLIAGAPCDDFTDCANGLVCSGLCATGATGGLNQLCPCNPGFLCTQQEGGLTLCKGGGGTPCQNNTDCASELCQSNGVCAAGSPNAFPCTSDSQCGSQNCSNGFCQNNGIVTGTLGAACANSSCVTFTGASCNSTPTEPLSCQCINGPGQPGTCVAATQGIISICSTLRACATDLVCFDMFAQGCDSGDTGCLCLFPYTDANTLATGSNCIAGMSPVGSECFNSNALGCDSGGMCAASVCGGAPVLAVYRFGRPDISNLRTNYVGATNTTIAPIPGPSGNISPHKLFSESAGNIDTIYLVDNLQGLLSLQYNPIAMSVVTPWTVLIPHTTTATTGGVTTTKTLIDAGYNGTNFLIAFDEVVTGGGRNDTVYIGTGPTNLVPFNVQSGPGITGTQYTTDGVALSIDYIDISRANDVSPGNDALISVNGTVYIKQSAEPRYSIGVIQGGPMNGNTMTGVTGPARFYFDNTENPSGTGPAICPQTGNSNNPIACPSYYNVSFVAPFRGFGGGSYDQVMQFSGNVAGIADPIDRFEETVHVQYRVFDYSIYSPVPGGMLQAGIIMLTSAFLNGTFIDNMVVLSLGGNTTPVPYRISPTSRSVASANAFYVISLSSCT